MATVWALSLARQQTKAMRGNSGNRVGCVARCLVNTQVKREVVVPTVWAVPLSGQYANEMRGSSDNSVVWVASWPIDEGNERQ